MEILASIAAFITTYFFFRGIVNLARHMIGKKKKDTSLMKKKAKQSGFAFVMFYVVTIVFGIMAGNRGETYTKSSTEIVAEKDDIQPDVEQELSDRTKIEADNNEQGIANDSKLEKAVDDEIVTDINDEGEYSEGNKGIYEDVYSEEDNDIYEDVYSEEDNDIYEDVYNEEETDVYDEDEFAFEDYGEEDYTPQELLEKAKEFDTLLTYSYADKKKGKKIVSIVEESQGAKDKEFMYLSEQKKLFSNKCTYEITLDRTDYVYYGETKKNKPNGYGVIYFKGRPVYIGELKKGIKSGYGIELEQDSAGYGYFISYEGEYADGFREGKGIELYPNSEGDNILDAYYYAITSHERTVLEHLDFCCNVPLFSNHIFYEGSFKDGIYDGKGKQYLGEYLIYEGKFKNGEYGGKGTLYYKNGQAQYKGEFKNGKYDGKGTLYNEDGSVQYKGKFKKGDIK